MTEPSKNDWLELCVAVANEADSDEVDRLLKELIRGLDDGRTTAFPESAWKRERIQ